MRLKRPRSRTSEFKWSNASRRFRLEVLSRLARSDLELFTLTVRKEGRQVEDTADNYAILLCELPQTCWATYPNMGLAMDRRFTSPAQVATLNTFVYRHWPAGGVLSISHMDSERSPLGQLADFVAGQIEFYMDELNPQT